MFTQCDAIVDAYIKLGGTRSIEEIKEWVSQNYTESWKDFGTTVPNASQFREEIKQLINNAKAEGKTYIDIISGEVHRKLGGYPSSNHRMATCCEVMYSMMKPTDQVIYAIQKGKGARLVIRYNSMCEMNF
ncbi:hypothetical protein [Ammoniphilus sp. YIM 78166]|uniref:hypothetical protein n=1 Tax=Ammoniphilus sp. YIM 78166 TaxID=1644106 RepID=UPI0010700435|nr:hypothetical protein [Ammoniphilus sp. YIM 78166]